LAGKPKKSSERKFSCLIQKQVGVNRQKSLELTIASKKTAEKRSLAAVDELCSAKKVPDYSQVALAVSELKLGCRS
jgi:hypothetical protein